jgi:hypothetical protein
MTALARPGKSLMADPRYCPANSIRLIYQLVD